MQIGIVRGGEESEEAEEDSEGLMGHCWLSNFGVGGAETAGGDGVTAGGLAAREHVAREVDTEG
jgi:hypothetical protein